MTLQKLILITLILAFFSLPAISQTESPAPPPPPPPVRIRSIPSDAGPQKVPGATVRGRLVYEDTGAPIRYAKIGFAKSSQRGRGSVDYVRTDELGNFVFPDIAPGEYYPVVENRGILNPSSFPQTFLSSAERDQVLESTFQKFAFEGLGEFQVFVRARRGAGITGSILYFDGEPAVGVGVEAIPLRKGRPVSPVASSVKSPHSEETDERGIYRFAGLPEGQYLIRVTEPVSHKNEKQNSYSYGRAGFRSNPFVNNPFQTYFPNGADPTAANLIEAYYGQTTEGVNITLPERILYDVSGMVVREDNGVRLKGFEVSFVPLVEKNDQENEKAGSDISKLVTLAMGRNGGNYGKDLPAEFAISNLPAGKYRLTATQQKRVRDGDDKVLKKPDKPYPSVSKEIEILDGDLIGIRIEIPVGGGLSGTLELEGGGTISRYLLITATETETGEIARSSFSAGRSDNGRPASSKGFEFESLVAGKYKLQVFGNEYYVKEILLGSSRVDDGSIEIENGNDISNVRIVLSSKMGVIKGRVSGHSPETDSAVIALKEGTDVMSAFAGGGAGASGRVKKDGSFEMKIAPGNYRLIVLNRFEMPTDPSGLVTWIEERRESGSSITIAAKEIKNIELQAQ